MLPLFYFKPSLCWIDDNRLFLEAIKIRFDEQYHRCNTFDTPESALHYFSGYHPPSSTIPLMRTFTESELFDIQDHYPIDVNLNAIIGLMNHQEKHNEIALVVADYHMPGKTGVEVFKELKGLPFKKILLTGEATPEDAVAAFNAGLIDQFIRKDRYFTEHIEHIIDNYVTQYFQEKTKMLAHHLEISQPTYFSDPIFIEFFKQWCDQNEVDEYYLIKRTGGFHIKHRSGATSFFILLSEREKHHFLSTNEELKDDLTDLFQAVADGKRIPFFGPGKEPWEFSQREWGNYFYPALGPIVGRETYHYAVIKNEG